MPTDQDTLTAAAKPTPLMLRNDTMLGICAALGRDLGFNPNYLRVAVSTIVLFDIMLAVGVYLGLGIIVAASRLLFPARYQACPAAGSGTLVEANDSPASPDALAA